MNRVVTFVIAAILVLSLGACGGGGSGASAGGSSAGSFDTEFPLPDSVSNFTETGGAINFQTPSAWRTA